MFSSHALTEGKTTIQGVWNTIKELQNHPQNPQEKSPSCNRSNIMHGSRNRWKRVKLAMMPLVPWQGERSKIDNPYAIKKSIQQFTDELSSQFHVALIISTHTKIPEEGDFDPPAP